MSYVTEPLHWCVSHVPEPGDEKFNRGDRFANHANRLDKLAKGLATDADRFDNLADGMDNLAIGISN